MIEARYECRSTHDIASWFGLDISGIEGNTLAQVQS